MSPRALALVLPSPLTAFPSIARIAAAAGLQVSRG